VRSRRALPLDPVLNALLLRGVVTEQQERLLVDPGLTRRTYTLWCYDPTRRRGVVRAGPCRVGVGEQVRLGRPEGSFTLRPDAAHHVFVGEETASVAFGAMTAALVSGCVETATAADRLPLRHSDRLDRLDRLDWLTRAARPLSSLGSCSAAEPELQPFQPFIAPPVSPLRITPPDTASTVGGKRPRALFRKEPEQGPCRLVTEPSRRLR
jgi:NADPH-dependent ferric siderophore reductase